MRIIWSSWIRREKEKRTKKPRDPRARGKQERPGRWPERPRGWSPPRPVGPLVNQPWPNPFPDLIMYIHTAGDGKWYALHVHTVYCGKGDQNVSTNVSISKLIIGTKPKRFDLVRLLSEQKQNVSICSKIIKNRTGTFWRFFFGLKTKPEWNRVCFLADRNVSIHLCFRGIKTELFIFKKLYQNETKTF